MKCKGLNKSLRSKFYQSVPLRGEEKERHLTQHREDDDARKHGGAAVAEGDGDGVSEAVVVHGVVGGERDQPTERQPQAEEDLGAGLQPHDGVS
ncbi:hypothetical protein TNIN_302101 [Trichonephila inaurata madagascariensis]|uniref:Uncharacterized protein n=1 Tax=Trichonephila inaurata madagascariensis TaxID=2747483 RepID=A0A8X6Y8W1_9ARAC|nr:hypothetical protein TNIN_302101 [Trichonephila inaurata madagascariensis]